MQEEVDSRTVALSISAAKFTGRLFKAAIGKYMAHRKEKKLQKARDGPVKPCGKQTVKQLIGQNQGVSTIESNDPEIKNFERIARKYGVDYAVKKVKTDGKLKKDRGEREKAVGSQKAQGFVSGRQRQSS